jgi:hypothetical protein
MEEETVSTSKPNPLEGVEERTGVMWNRRKIFLDGLISPHKHIQLSQTPTPTPVEHALPTPSQQAAQQLPSPHTK